MEIQEALNKFEALSQASAEEDPGRCCEEVFVQLFNITTYEGTDPDKMNEAVEAAAIVLTLTLGDDEEEEEN